MNLRLTKHPIYLTRHGKSINNSKNIIGGDCYLTDEGNEYGERLKNHMENEKLDDFIIITSCLKRTKQTVEKFNNKKIESRLLNEIHGGICENMTFEDVEEKYPDIIRDRKKDKLRYRYPEGESYVDLFERLRYFVLELGSYNKPILIVAHNAIIKVLLSYFQEIDHKEIPHLNIKLHQLIKLMPNSKNYNIERFNI
jgi:broad specificity phosphatase PhoE